MEVTKQMSQIGKIMVTAAAGRSACSITVICG
jgi:hypothetical protein